MKEIGVGFATRMMAKGLKPRLVISENGAKWAIRSESALKTTNLEFTPGQQFDETTPDGREVTVNQHLLLFNSPFICLFFSQRLTSKMINGFIHQ